MGPRKVGGTTGGLRPMCNVSTPAGCSSLYPYADATRWREPRHRCSVLAQWGCVTPEQYGLVDACRSYPRSAYPWEEAAPKRPPPSSSPQR
jgi:hypothetical protein